MAPVTETVPEELAGRAVMTEEGLTEGAVAQFIATVSQFMDDQWEEASTYVRLYADVVPTELTAEQTDWLHQFADAVANAIEVQSVRPNETIYAIGWAAEALHVRRIPLSDIRDGLFTSALTTWGLEHGRMPQVSPGDVVETEAKLSPKSREVHAPGVTHEVAKAITAAIAAEWDNTLRLNRATIDQLTGEIRAVETVARRAYDGTEVGQTTIDQLRRLIEGATAKIDKTLAGDAKELVTLTDDITRLRTGFRELQVKQHEDYVRLNDDAKTLKRIEGTVTHEGKRLNTQQLEIHHTALQVGELLPLLPLLPMLQYQPLLQKLPTKILTLEDCCYENCETTTPIRNGGANRNLLSHLGQVLSKWYALALLGMLAEALLSLLDMPAAIFASVRSAEWVSGYAVAAAETVLDMVDYAGVIASVPVQ